MLGLEWINVFTLILSGLTVGFINTLAGGGTVISMSIFLLMGLPPLVANGTNRVAIFLQNLTSVYYFHKKKLIDWGKIKAFAIPIILGSLFGASFSFFISHEFFKYVFSIAIFIFALSLIFNPNRWITENKALMNRPYTWVSFLIYFSVGVYGGLIHVGIGYALIALFVLYSGRDLVGANIMKSLVVMLYVPFSLVIFAIQGDVAWKYGFVHGIGNIIGAYFASHLALKTGANFIRYVLIFLVGLVFLQFIGILTPENIQQWISL